LLLVVSLFAACITSVASRGGYAAARACAMSSLSQGEESLGSDI
jgi:hypothetical protein